MASSRSDAGRPDAAAVTTTAFALQEMIACWNQAYEALARGDLDRVAALLDVAEDHVAAAGDGHLDSTAEALLRQEATTAHGRLQHGMRAGLAGLQDELARARVGGKALRGYGNPAAGVGGNVTRQI